LEWTGHVVRTDQGRRVKKIFENKPEGSRRRLRWLEDVERELWDTKGKKQLQKAVDREVWASDIKEVKALRGP
jgi:DNA-binding PadR family transcriptional regulator